MPAADPDLVRAIARGSRDALGELYDRHAALMMGVAVKILGDRRDAEEVVHDAFLEAWFHAGDYDPERSSVKTWLLLRLRSRCLDLLRSAARRRTDPLERAGEHAVAPPESSRAVDAGRVTALVQALPEDQREVLALAYFADLSMSEIAETLSIPLGTVKSRVARGLARIKERITETP